MYECFSGICGEGRFLLKHSSCAHMEKDAKRSDDNNDAYTHECTYRVLLKNNKSKVKLCFGNEIYISSINMFIVFSDFIR